ncbi:MAG TPA: hypothetical protein ENI23_07310 [bacterium]|nr:hypothetical protein [bacterium]
MSRPTVTEINKKLQEAFFPQPSYLEFTQEVLQSFLEGEQYETVEQSLEALVIILYNDLTNTIKFLEILGEETK